MVVRNHEQNIIAGSDFGAANGGDRYGSIADHESVTNIHVNGQRRAKDARVETQSGSKARGGKTLQMREKSLKNNWVKAGADVAESVLAMWHDLKAR